MRKCRFFFGGVPYIYIYISIYSFFLIYLFIYFFLSLFIHLFFFSFSELYQHYLSIMSISGDRYGPCELWQVTSEPMFASWTLTGSYISTVEGSFFQDFQGELIPSVQKFHESPIRSNTPLEHTPGNPLSTQLVYVVRDTTGREPCCLYNLLVKGLGFCSSSVCWVEISELQLVTNRMLNVQVTWLNSLKPT